MNLYINYDDDVIIDLTPDEILEDQQLENQYFYQDNQDQNESNKTTDTSKPLENPDNLFFDLSYYNLGNPQNNQAPNTTPEVTTSNSKKRSLLDDNIVLLKQPSKKKVSSAWSNLELSSNSDKNSSKDSKTYFTDNGHIDPKFRSTHVSYATKKKLKAQKAEKEREKMIMEEENERISSGNISPYSGDMDVFYKEVIRRPLDGIHVEVEEKFEIDW